MNLTTHLISDSELASYGLTGAQCGDNARVAALYRQQLDSQSGWPRLIGNMQKYARILRCTLDVRSIPIGLMLNETRAPSLTAQTFERKAAPPASQPCHLCELEQRQKAVLAQGGQYLLLINPGVTMPGDLTIASVHHRPQLIAGFFGDMIALSRSLSDYSIFYNGAMAGASIPHFHFQAGQKDTLPAEEQIQKLLHGFPVGQARLVELYDSPVGEVYGVRDFLRATYLIRSKETTELERLFRIFYDNLLEVDVEIVNIPNIPDFGSYIEVMGMHESEPRMNLMLKYDPSSGEYLLAIFPKVSNRPAVYFKRGSEQIIVGMAIKESLGNLICCRRSDYQKLRQSDELVAELYRDTSISERLTDQLNRRLARLASV